MLAIAKVIHYGKNRLAASILNNDESFGRFLMLDENANVSLDEIVLIKFHPDDQYAEVLNLELVEGAIDYVNSKVGKR